MTQSDFSNADAQTIRAQWFSYLDTIEAARRGLHAYCLSLTGNIWDAEDLLQETLLRGFAMTARGDLHGETSPVSNAKAYLFRVATNNWIDIRRKTAREVHGRDAEATVEDVDSAAVSRAIEKAVALSSPQEFAALVLKEGYDFTLQEIADFVGTTPGTIKSALSRARRKMKEDTHVRTVHPENQRVARRFVNAVNDGDLNRVKELMSETLSLVVCNVGGGRGRDGIWTEKSVPNASASYAECDGEAIVVLRDRDSGVAYDVVRIEASDGVATRITDYCYAPETLAQVAKKLGIEIETTGYHQPPETIREMVRTTGLPWR